MPRVQKPIPIQEAGNPHYPLPADYVTLTREGQRQARVNACRQWRTTSDPDLAGARRCTSLHFFDTYYLMPDEDLDWDPGFYDQAPLPVPSFHWDMVRAWGSGMSVACTAPRGGAKSTLLTKDSLLISVTHPKYSLVYATSTHDNAISVGQAIKNQAYFNQRIQDDFAPEFGRTSLAPRRSEQPTSLKNLYLNNGSKVRLVSAESRIRGVRPLKFRLDDIEYDSKNSTPMEQLREYAERLVFKIALPTVLRANASLDITGTFVSRRHYLWAIIQHILDGGRQDPRFSPALWKALLCRACEESPEGKLVSCWPHMWPSDDEEKRRLRLPPSSKTIVQIREMLGPAVFQAEFMANPGSSEDSFFKRDTSPQGRHSWWLESVDPDAFALDPRTASGYICWLEKQTLHRKTLPEFFANSRLFATVDTAYTENATSDRRTCHIQALHSDNVLFSLDLWSDRKPDSVLMDAAFRMCQRWKCPDIFVEVVRESLKIYVRMKSAVETRLSRDLSYSFHPQVHDLRPGTLAKTDKIATLDVRFDLALVKLPTFLSGRHAPYTRLFEQIDSFNPISQDGGLQHDDELDTLSMSTQVIRGRLRRPPAPTGPRVIDPIAEIKAGRPTLHGMNLIDGIPFDRIPVSLLDSITAPPPVSTSLLSTTDSP